MNKKLAALFLVPALSVGALWSASSSAQASSLPEATIVKSVNFRTTPSTSGSVIGLLRTGETVDVLEKTNNYWYKVRSTSGQVGYVSTSTSYIKVAATAPAPVPTPTPTPTPTPVPVQPEATVVKSVNLRSTPSTSGTVLGLVQTGETLVLLEKTNSWWYKVRTEDGRVGYVSTSSQYISVTGTAPAPAPTPAPTQPTTPTGTTTTVASKVINAGMKYIGTPYEYGSSRSTTATFDCSDFVRQAFLDGAGITLPADSRQQAEYVKARGRTTTDWRQLKPGDIVFFIGYKGYKASDYVGIDKAAQRITHDAIYIGDGKILHTYSTTSGGVRVDTLEGKSWEYRMIFGGSAL